MRQEGSGKSKRRIQSDAGTKCNVCFCPALHHIVVISRRELFLSGFSPSASVHVHVSCLSACMHVCICVWCRTSVAWLFFVVSFLLVVPTYLFFQ